VIRIATLISAIPGDHATGQVSYFNSDPQTLDRQQQ
jgi:hypothetical protein